MSNNSADKNMGRLFHTKISCPLAIPYNLYGHKSIAQITLIKSIRLIEEYKMEYFVRINV